MKFDQNIELLVNNRISTRTFEKREIERSKISTFKEFFKSENDTPFGSKVNIDLIELHGHNRKYLKSLGTYGVIKNSHWFIGGSVKNGYGSKIDYGYIFEKAVLLAEDLGLGTCWLGGTFDRGRFLEKINPSPDSVTPAVLALGYPLEKMTKRDRFFRFAAGSHNRFPWSKLFYLEDYGVPLSKANAGKWRIPLDMVRVAPSASNRQPWRVLFNKEKGQFHFFLERTKLYTLGMGLLKIPDLQKVDMGIAMAHFQLSSESLNLSGNWITKPLSTFKDIPQNSEYIVSWQIEE
jgi:Putative TM nitroreductase